ncbi:MAG: pilus assembly protein [Planctomycetales bacterium]
MLTSRFSRNTPRSERKGAAMAEMALLLPVLFLFLFGIIEWSWIMFVRQSMYNAAREGIRAMAVQGEDEAAAIATTNDFLDKTVGTNFPFVVTVTETAPGTLLEYTMIVEIPVGDASIVKLATIGGFVLNPEVGTIRASDSMLYELGL